MTTVTTRLAALGAMLALCACGGTNNSQNGGGGGIFNGGTISTPISPTFSTSYIATPNVPTTTAATLPGPYWSIDVSTVDAASGLLYLSDKTNCGVDVYDLNANAYVTTIGPTTAPPAFGKAGASCASIGSIFQGNTGKSTTSGPNGLVRVGSKLYAGDGNGTIKVINLATRAVTGTIVIPGATFRTDEGSFDPDDNVMLIASDAETAGPILTYVNTQTDTVIATTVRTNATGMEASYYSPSLKKFVQSVPVTKANPNGEIDIIDPTTRAVVAVYALPGKCGPTGIANGPQNRAVVACGDVSNTYVMDVGSGQFLATINQAGGGDGAAYDATTNRYYVANSNNTSTGVKGGPLAPVTTVIDANSSFFIQNIPSEAHAHWVSTYNGRAYVPIPSQGLAVYK